MIAKVSLALVASAFMLVLIAISMLINYAYGLRQGGDTLIMTVWGWRVTESQSMGMLALAVDALHFLLPVTVVILMAMKMRTAAGATAVVALLISLWSAQSAISYLVSARSEATDVAGKQATQWTLAETAMADAQRRRKFIPDHRPLAIVDADITTLMQQDAWRKTEQCTDPERVPAKFCARYNLLRQERASATEADKADAQIETLRRELDARPRVTEADPLSAMVGPSLGVSGGFVAAARGGLLVVIVELLTLLVLPATWAPVIFHKSKEYTSPDMNIPPQEFTSPPPQSPAVEPLETSGNEKNDETNHEITHPRLVVNNDKSRRAPISDEEVFAILDMRRSGMSQAEISRTMKRPQGSISRIINKHKPALGRMARMEAG